MLRTKLGGMAGAPVRCVRRAAIWLVVVEVGCSSQLGTATTTAAQMSAPDIGELPRLRPARRVEPGMMAIDPGTGDSAAVHEAVAVLAPTKGSHVSGVVRFREDENGLDVSAAIDGLTGSVLAYHVHVFGDCSSDDGGSAGPHFHFAGSSFGRPPRTLIGNLGELFPDGNLTTRHRARLRATLHGGFSIVGRAVVVQERSTEVGAPRGASDGPPRKRFACGVIGAANPSARPAEPPPR